jgi:hypothetical protein
MSTPNTLATAQALVAYMQALTINNNPVYTLVSLGEIKDVVDNIANGGACLEIYATSDDSQHKAFGGVIWDEQSWDLLSIVSLTNAQAAEELIYACRDALVVPVMSHFTLNQTGNIFFSRLKPNSGKFFYVERNGQWLRAHVIEVVTTSQWQATLSQ